jgi:hypothetical protein
MATISTSRKRSRSPEKPLGTFKDGKDSKNATRATNKRAKVNKCNCTPWRVTITRFHDSHKPNGKDPSETQVFSFRSLPKAKECLRLELIKLIGDTTGEETAPLETRSLKELEELAEKYAQGNILPRQFSWELDAEQFQDDQFEDYESPNETESENEREAEEEEEEQETPKPKRMDEDHPINTVPLQSHTQVITGKNAMGMVISGNSQVFMRL